jgi:hypothetical protein
MLNWGLRSGMVRRPTVMRETRALVVQSWKSPLIVVVYYVFTITKK